MTDEIRQGFAMAEKIDCRSIQVNADDECTCIFRRTMENNVNIPYALRIVRVVLNATAPNVVEMREIQLVYVNSRNNAPADLRLLASMRDEYKYELGVTVENNRRLLTDLTQRVDDVNTKVEELINLLHVLVASEPALGNRQVHASTLD